MDNDDKVKELSLFLGEELAPLRRSKKVQVYDLETEYAKTRKNRLWSVWIALGLTFAVFVLVTVFTIRGIGRSNDRIDVNLSAFEDLTLQNLFNQLEKAQEQFDQASKRRAALQGNLEARLERAKQKMQSDLELLSGTRLSRAALAERRQKIQSEYDAEISEAHEELDAQLKAADVEVKQYEEQLKAYDSENVARAQEWEKKMDAERQARQLERQRLVDSYEKQLSDARALLEETRKRDFEDRKSATSEITKRYEQEIATYDPVINDSRTAGVLAGASQKPLGAFSKELLLADGAPDLGEEFSAALSSAEADYKDLEYLYSKSEAIPQRNTMKSVVAGEKKLSYALANGLARAAIDEIKARDAAANEEIGRLKDSLSKAEGERAKAVEERDYQKAASRAYVDILNSSLADEKTAGFVLDPNAAQGAAVFIRDSWFQSVSRDGSTRVDVYNGKSRAASGFLVYYNGNYFVSLDPGFDAAGLSVGNTFRIKTK